VIGFVAGAIIGFAAYGTAVSSPLTGIYVPMTVVLVGLIALVHRAVRFSLPVLWALALAGVGNMAGGVFLVDDRPLYLAPVVGAIHYDKLFHAAATGVAAWASWQALEHWSITGRGRTAFAAVLMACGAGALVEVVEFTGTRVFPTTNVGDYGNNMLDLVANLAGALVAAAVLARRGRAAAHLAGNPAGGSIAAT
jgi:hypothetical protein